MRKKTYQGDKNVEERIRWCVDLLAETIEMISRIYGFVLH